MATVYWPPDVNQAHIVGSYSEKPETNVAEFAPEVGPPKRRRRSSVSSDLLSWEMYANAAERVSLRNFYRSDLADGVLIFKRKHPATNDMATFQFAAEPQYKEFAFVRGTPRYRVTISVRLMP